MALKRRYGLIADAVAELRGEIKKHKMIKSFPKVFAIGTDYISSIFEGIVEITEKIDGSQFVFGKLDDVLYLRSKGQQIFPENPDKMFKEAVNYICSIEEKIPNNTVFYCEYLKKPKHNILNYSSIPRNHLILFGVADKTEKFYSYDALCKYAEMLDIDIVPRIYIGKINNAEEIIKLLDRESILGGTNIEGIVVKNYNQPFLLGGQPIPLMAGKYVSEKFKETHRKNWGKEFTGKGKWEVFKDSFRTNARWEKAIQHLQEKNELENSPRDIGKLILEIKNDITEEEKENIKEFLWKEFGEEVLRYSTKGFPEFYKEKLLKSNF